MIRQLGAVLRFELRHHFRRISTWVYFGLLTVAGVILMGAAGGVWEAFDSGGGGRIATAPLEITQSLGGLFLITLPITAALFGQAVYRDFHVRIHPLLFTSPLSRTAYLLGRFAGALLANLFILAGAGLGLAVASRLPMLLPERVGPFQPLAYLQAYGYLILPSLVFAGALFFALAALTRQMLPNYIGGVGLLVGYSIAMRQLSDLDDRRVGAMLDPFGLAPLGLATRYWTVAESNARLLPFDGIFLSNRLVWLGVAAAVMGLLFWRFRFSHLALERRARRSEEELLPVSRAAPRPRVPVVHPAFGAGAHLRQYLSTARRAFWGIVRSVYFAALVGVGAIFTLFQLSQMGEIYETTTHPVTYSVIEAVTAGFVLFLVIILTFYAGELVWEERDLRASQLHDAAPVAPWVPFAAKLTALVGVVAVLQAVLMLLGIGAQLVQGYTRIELGQYLSELFVRQLVGFALLAALAMLVHVLVNHKYVGHFVMILYYVATPIALIRFGWDHNLYHLGGGGETRYSDMNGFGHSWEPWAWFNLYWAAFALLLAVASTLLWVRGEETGTAWRMRLARLRFSRPARVAAGFACLLFVGTGGFAFYNTNVLNEYRTSKSVERAQAEYERRYSRFLGIPQPRIVGVELAVDLYPEQRDVRARGSYRLVNRAGVAIDSLHVNFPSNVTRKRFRFDRPSSPVVQDDEHGYHVYRLEAPLAPGDSVRLEWEVDYLTRGFTNSVENGPVIANGTFVRNAHFPSIGYDDQGELRDNDTRRKHGLEPKHGDPEPDDARGRMNPYISTDADWVSFAATVSTSADQTVVAPGALRRQWTREGRRFFRYEMDAPMLNYYSLLSARYAVRRDQWGDVALAVYHHPEHRYNLERMLHAAKKSLAYYTENFGPYPHRELRIVEFPRYQSFAEAFPTTVPFSEGAGFIARVDPDDVDYVFHTTAHEVAHQWWAHQVMGGRVRGSALMSESISEYAALVVMEKEYGQDGVKKFLRHELEGYLRGRTFERKKEVPLVRMDAEQLYLRYNKGALALYALRDYLGEERLNGALRAYLNDRKYQQPPYTNSLEFVRYLRAATPDSLQYVVDDLFEHITLYENRARSATATRTADGRHQVEIQLDAKKMRADSLGSETEVPMADWVDVGVFAKSETKEDRLGAPLYLRKHRLTSGEQTLRVVVDREPARAGVDPYHRLIDRQMSDNTVPVKEGAQP